MMIRCAYCGKRPGHRPGAAACELAIALPFLVLLFLAALDFTRVYFATQALDNCAYAGALFASGASQAPGSGANGAVTSQDRSTAAVGAAVAEGASLNPPLNGTNVQVSYSGSLARVTVTYNFPMLTPFLGSSRQVTLTRLVTMQQLY